MNSTRSGLSRTALGKAMARGFAESGADMVISSRHENELNRPPPRSPRGPRPRWSTSWPT